MTTARAGVRAMTHAALRDEERQDEVASLDGQPARQLPRLPAPLLPGELPPGVRLHTGPVAAATAAAHRARAFTVGRDIWFGSGASPSDRALLGHELAHVAQQSRAAAPSGEMPIIASPALEREATSLAPAFAAPTAITGGSHIPAASAVSAAPAGVQRQELSGGDAPPKARIELVGVQNNYQLMELWVEDVLVARLVAPMGGKPTINVETEFGMTFRMNSESPAFRTVRVGVQKSAGVRLQWVQGAQEAFNKKGMTPDLRLGPLHPTVKPAAKSGGGAASNTAGGTGGGAKATPPPPQAATKEEQELLDEIRAAEAYASKPGLTPEQLKQTFKAQLELQKQLDALRYGRSEPPPKAKPEPPPPEPHLRTMSIDPDELSGGALADEVAAARKWADAQQYSSEEMENLRRRLAIMEGALAERQKSLLAARKAVGDLAAAQRAGALMGNDSNVAGFAFAAGFLGAAMLEIRPAEWTRLKDQISGEPVDFAMGATFGVIEGMLEGLWDNVSGLAELLWKLSVFNQVYQTAKDVKALWDDPAAYMAEKEKSWADAKAIASGLGDLITAMVKDPAFMTVHGGELGEIAGHHAAAWFNDGFMRMSVGDKGELLGKVTGRVILEIALLFLGPEEWVARGATALGQGVRISGKLAKAIIELMEKVPGLRKILQAREGFTALREAALAGKEITAGEKLLQEMQNAEKLEKTIQAGKDAKLVQQGVDAQKGAGVVTDVQKGTGAVTDVQKGTGAAADVQKGTGTAADAQKSAGAVQDASKVPPGTGTTDPVPSNVRQLPPPKKVTPPPTDVAAAEEKALKEGKLAQRRIGDAQTPTNTPPQTPPNAQAKPVPNVAEEFEEIEVVEGNTVTKKWVKKGGGPPPGEDLTPKAVKGGGGGTKGGTGTSGPKTTAPKTTAPSTTPKTATPKTGGGGGGGGTTPPQKVAPPPGRTGPGGKRVLVDYPPQAWHDIAAREGKFPALRDAHMRPTSRPGGVTGILDETVTTSGTPYSFEAQLRDGRAVQLDWMTEKGVVQENKALTSIEQRWESELEKLEEAGHGESLPDTAHSMMGEENDAVKLQRRIFEGRIQSQTDELMSQMRRQSQFIRENGLPAGEWRVGAEDWAEKLATLAKEEGITNIRIIGPE